jgi:hypothetical protein
VTVEAHFLNRSRPLAAVVCAVPLVGEAMSSALDFAEVRPFAASGGDIPGLLRSLRPDVVVVDSDDGARDALAYAMDTAVPVLHVDVENGNRLVDRIRERIARRVVTVDDDDVRTQRAQQAWDVAAARGERPHLCEVERRRHRLADERDSAHDCGERPRAVQEMRLDRHAGCGTLSTPRAVV